MATTTWCGVDIGRGRAITMFVKITLRWPPTACQLRAMASREVASCGSIPIISQVWSCGRNANDSCGGSNPPAPSTKGEYAQWIELGELSSSVCGFESRLSHRVYNSVVNHKPFDYNTVIRLVLSQGGSCSNRACRLDHNVSR